MPIEFYGFKFYYYFSGINLFDGIRHDQLLELGLMHRAHHRRSPKEEKLSRPIFNSNGDLHFNLSRTGRLVLFEKRGERHAQQHRHPRGSDHQHLLFDCSSSTVPAAQAPRAKLPSVFARNQPTAADSPKL